MVLTLSQIHKFTNSSQILHKIISTRLLTVLTPCVILQLEQRRGDKKRMKDNGSLNPQLPKFQETR